MEFLRALGLSWGGLVMSSGTRLVPPLGRLACLASCPGLLCKDFLAVPPSLLGHPGSSRWAASAGG